MAEDIDEEIARLEAELQNESGSSGSGGDSDASSDADDDDEGPRVFKTQLSEEDIIPPLPSAHLPSITFKAPKEEKRDFPEKKSKKNRAPQAPVVPRSVKQAELQAYIRGYEPSERRPFYCRLCSFQVKN